MSIYTKIAHFVQDYYTVDNYFSHLDKASMLFSVIKIVMSLVVLTGHIKGVTKTPIRQQMGGVVCVALLRLVDKI